MTNVVSSGARPYGVPVPVRVESPEAFSSWQQQFDGTVALIERDGRDEDPALWWRSAEDGTWVGVRPVSEDEWVDVPAACQETLGVPVFDLGGQDEESFGPFTVLWHDGSQGGAR